jgi:hypothetical protein
MYNCDKNKGECAFLFVTGIKTSSSIACRIIVMSISEIVNESLGYIYPRISELRYPSWYRDKLQEQSIRAGSEQGQGTSGARVWGSPTYSSIGTASLFPQDKAMLPN